MAKLPAFQFYPGDWLKDPDLRFCSPFARALLVDLLCLCFEAKRRGVLAKANGTPWTAKDINAAIGTGMTLAQVEDALNELEENAVLKREESTGCLYSARMVRDEEIRQTRKQAGSKGGSKRVANAQANGQAKGQAKTGSSSSSSSSDKKGDVWERPEPVDAMAWADFETHRAAIRKPLTDQARTKNANILLEYPPDVQRQIVDTSIANRWTGLFPPKWPVAAVSSEPVRPSAREL